MSDCEHDTSKGEQCLTLHVIDGVAQPPCTRCAKCHEYVPAPRVAPQVEGVALQRRCICASLGLAISRRCGFCTLEERR